MTTCPKCHHEFDEPTLRVRTIDDFADHLLSADAEAAYQAACTHPEPGNAAGYQFLVGLAEVSHFAQASHADTIEADRARQILRMAHVYNRCVQARWVSGGVLMPLCRLPMAQLSTHARELLCLYPRTDLTQQQLNEHLGGHYLFVQEGEIAHRDAWDAYAATNGLE